MGVSWSTSGNTRRTDAFLAHILADKQYSSLDSYGRKGVDALRSATPVDSRLTSESWTYEIEKTSGRTVIWWKNTNEVDGFNVAIGLRYGHSTGTGGWVQGYNFIAPALKPIFDQIADAVWKEVQQA